MSESPPLSILLAYGDKDARNALLKVLTEARQDQIQICQSGAELIHLALTIEPDSMITGVGLLEIDGTSALRTICENTQIPAIIIAPKHSRELVEKSLHDHVMVYLIEPIRAEEVLPTISLGIRRFEECQALRYEVAPLKQALGDRKIFERAKWLLMQPVEQDEEGAYQRLRRLATDKRIRAAEAAAWVLKADQAFGPAP